MKGLMPPPACSPVFEHAVFGFQVQEGVFL